MLTSIRPVSYTHLDVYKRQECIECERGLAGTGQSGYDDQLVAGNFHINIFQIIDACPLNVGIDADGRRLLFYCINYCFECLRLVHCQIGQNLAAVSYTHLDVYKRQSVSLILSR